MKTAELVKTKPTICFNATLIQNFLTLPKNVSAKLPKQTTIMVEGMINNFPFRAALKPDGKGSHELKMSKAMRGALGVAAQEIVTVEITRKGVEPEIRVPIDLQKALKASPRARDSWADITPMARRDWIFSICSSRLPETRKRRIEKACDMLASGKRRLCCFPGIKWMMKENAKSCGMWLPLLNAKKKNSI